MDSVEIRSSEAGTEVRHAASPAQSGARRELLAGPVVASPGAPFRLIRAGGGEMIPRR